MSRLSFRVHGDPRPQGSKRHVGNGILVESGGLPLKMWREDVKQAALQAIELAHVERFTAAVELNVVFSLRRPQSHFRTGSHQGELKPSAPMFHTHRPDVDKLLRSTLDAMTAAGVYVDDAQLALVTATKTYCDPDEPPGAYVRVDALIDDGMGGKRVSYIETADVGGVL